MGSIVETVLQTMSTVKKPQRKFMQTLFAVLMVFQGRATFMNMERYSHISEKRFRRWSGRSFDFGHFNTQLLLQTFPEGYERIAAIDASFMSKSGRKTEGVRLISANLSH